MTATPDTLAERLLTKAGARHDPAWPDAAVQIEAAARIQSDAVIIARMREERDLILSAARAYPSSRCALKILDTLGRARG